MTARRRRLAAAVAASVPVVALAGSARAAHRGCVGPGEERIFRVLNNRSELLALPVWMVMQAGSLGAVYGLAGAAAGRRRFRSAAVVAAYGTAVWAGVKLVKPSVGRGRPTEHLEGVVVRGEQQRGLGYPSGHAAVSLTLGLMTPQALGLGPRSFHNVAASGVAALAGASRMYVGAHLPLDVLGGWAIGAVTGRLGSVLLDQLGDPTRARVVG